MAYIGPIPAETFTSFATQTFSTSATSSYTLDHPVTNENELALFINNVRQQPGSGKAYTATGTALTLSANTASTDTMYAVFLGRALQTVNPADASVGTSQLAATSVTGAKLNTDVISAQTALAAEPADTDEFLVSDAGVLKRIDYSLIKGSSTHTLLSTTTVSSGVSTVDITSNIDSTYKKYMFDVIGMKCTDDQNINIRVFNSSIETGSVYSQFSVDGNQTSATPGGTATQDTGVGITIGLSVGGVDIESLNSRIFLNNPSEAVLNKLIEFSSVYHDSSEKASYTAGVGNCTDVAAITGIRFYPSSGTISAGVIKLYGIT